MTVVPSIMLPLGTKAVAFELPEPAANNKLVSLGEIAEDSKALLIMFLANHCPYTQHVLKKLPEIAATYQQKGLAAVAINSTDIEAHPEDSPEEIANVARSQCLTFPYLFDETQNVAKAYQASCTPDFYVYNPSMSLVYRGQFDASRPGNAKQLTGNDLKEAIEATLAGRPVGIEQKPSTGCNIKWRPGNEPEYYFG